MAWTLTDIHAKNQAGMPYKRKKKPNSSDNSAKITIFAYV